MCVSVYFEKLESTATHTLFHGIKQIGWILMVVDTAHTNEKKKQNIIIN